MKNLISLVFCGLVMVKAQQSDPRFTEREKHTPLPISVCSTGEGCKTENTSIVLEFDRRSLYRPENLYQKCVTEGVWDPSVCPDNKTCAMNCKGGLEESHGVSTYQNEITIDATSVVLPRFMLSSPDPSKYRMFNLLNQEFSFDIYLSRMYCGMSLAVYFVSMQEDGGASKDPTSIAGANYGTGYCNANCSSPQFVEGLANFGMPTPSGKYGLCCAELDVWEGNGKVSAFTSHSMSKPGISKCSNDLECGYGDNANKGLADTDGCRFNSYANGNQSFFGYGRDFVVNTDSLITVVTQFITDDHTANGKLIEIRRLYKQGNTVIANSVDKAGKNSLTDEYCAQSNPDYVTQHGGLTSMGEEMRRGMVLVLEMREADNRLESDPNGPCPADSRRNTAQVKISNIRVGDIDSTYDEEPHTIFVPTITPTPTPGCNTRRPPPFPSVPRYSQCGGIGYTGVTACAEGTCTKLNDWYFQCV